MKTHNIPATALPVGKIRVLVVDSDNNAATTLADNLRTNTDYEVQTVQSSFETGATIHKFAPHVMLINMLAEDIDATHICTHIRADQDLQGIKIIALANRLNDCEATALLNKGFDAYVSDLSDIAEVINRIEQATAIVY